LSIRKLIFGEGNRFSLVRSRKRVGLLLDSVNDNVGDKAIRIVMEEFLIEQGVEFKVLNPFSFDHKDYRIIIVGGGHLLRDPGDLFYDNFRVAGKHILNAVGVSTSKAVEYLNEYVYVSVRSKGDWQRISTLVKDIRIVPCPSVLMRGERCGVNVDRNSIGFHFHSASLASCPDCASFINAFPNHSKYFMSFTPYNRDMETMRFISRRVPGSKTIFGKDPKHLFDIVGRIGFMVCSSLHAAIFAYMNRVPFIVFPYVEKVKEFMEDRGLEKWMFTSSQEMYLKLNDLMRERLDYSRLVEKDLEKARNHLQEIRAFLE